MPYNNLIPHKGLMVFIPQFKYTLDKFKEISCLQESPFKTHHRLKVFAKKGCKCVSCGIEGTILARGVRKNQTKSWDVYSEDFTPLTIDHIVPKSKGGTNDMDNLQPMCITCNQLKGNKMTMNYPEFIAFPKIPRLHKECVVTEKIDGTNGLIYITDDGDMFVGSRNRWLSEDSDNFGFHRWAMENKDELMKLGAGRHHGEWWGSGIQRGYNLPKGEKRFSLFNVSIWNEENKPACCYVVPTLYTEEFDTAMIERVMYDLKEGGSFASPGFMNVEGVMVFHSSANHYFKVPFDKNHKG